MGISTGGASLYSRVGLCRGRARDTYDTNRKLSYENSLWTAMGNPLRFEFPSGYSED